MQSGFNGLEPLDGSFWERGEKTNRLDVWKIWNPFRSWEKQPNKSITRIGKLHATKPSMARLESSLDVYFGTFKGAVTKTVVGWVKYIGDGKLRSYMGMSRHETKPW